MKKFCLLILAAATTFGCGANTTTNNNSVNTNKAAMNAANSVAANSVAANSVAANSVAPSNTAAVPPIKTDLNRVFGGTTLNADERTAVIQNYVDEIETKLPEEDQSSPTKLQRREIDLKSDSLKGVTDENWAKLHIYSDGQTVERLKVYAPEGSEKSEEFYFYGEKPVFIFLEPKGKNIEAGDGKAVGDKFYFGSEGLFSWIKADGSKPAATSEEFKKMNEKLMKEATAFKAVK